MLWACVWLPHLALDTVLRRHPAPEKPIALVHGPPQRRALLATNAAAQAKGLQAGQSFSTAQALLPDLTAIESDEDSVTQARRLLAAWAYRYSSQVSLAFDDAVVLEIQGSLGLFGP